MRQLYIFRTARSGLWSRWCVCNVLQPNSVALYLYDAVSLYLKTVHQMVGKGSNYRRGSSIQLEVEGITFNGRWFRRVECVTFAHRLYECIETVANGCDNLKYALWWVPIVATLNKLLTEKRNFYTHVASTDLTMLSRRFYTIDQETWLPPYKVRCSFDIYCLLIFLCFLYLMRM